MTAFLLPAQMLRLMKNSARLHAPREACGVLFADARSGRLERIAELTNVADHHLDFAFDPQEQLNLWVAEERRGRVPAVLWHSHPTGALFPSPADQMCMAMHARLTHVIVNPSFARAFRWYGHPVEVDLRLTPGSIKL